MNPIQACSIPMNVQGCYGYVYCLTFPNGKHYVGQTTKQWKSRWRGHISKFSFCCALKSAIKKYSPESISWQILGYAKTKEELDKLERDFILQVDALYPNGYNLISGGNNQVFSDETRKKMSISTILYNLKKRFPQEDQEQLYRKAVFKYADELGNVDMGMNVVSFLTANNQHICLHEWQYNSRVHTKEMYSSSMGEKIKCGLRSKQRQLRGKRVCCVELNEVYSCTMQAVEKHPEWSKDKINACCIGINKTHFGYHFYRPDDPEGFLEELKEKWNK